MKIYITDEVRKKLETGDCELVKNPVEVDLDRPMDITIIGSSRKGRVKWYSRK